MNANNISLIVTPSAKTIKATFSEIIAKSEVIKKDIASLLITLEAVNDILDIFTNSNNSYSQIRSVNPITWSIPATTKLVVDVISKYVTKKTGISFSDWVNFIASILSKFTDYTKRLDEIQAIALKYDDNNSSKTNTSINSETEQDEVCLLQIKSETITWKNYIEKTTKLSTVLDAIIDAQNETVKQTIDKDTTDNEVAGDIKRMWGAITSKPEIDTQNKTNEFQKQLINWFFSSIYDLKGKTKNFNNQTRELLPELSNLENLLELEIVQIQAQSGKIKKEEVNILSVRIGATIIVPQLKEKINKHKKDIADYNKFLEKLALEFASKNLTPETHNLLLEEYKDNLLKAENLLNHSLTEAELWKKTGATLIESGISWTNKELEIIRTRRLVGQISLDELKTRSKFLNEEMHRLEDAKKILASL